MHRRYNLIPFLLLLLYGPLAALPGAGRDAGKVLVRLQTCYAEVMRLDLQKRAKG